MYVIGTDEAGYGPNLGPLVVSTTLWCIPDEHRDANLYRLLKNVIAPGPVAKEDTRRAPIADSKRLYQAGGTWEQLELGLLSALGLCGKAFCSWRDVWGALAPRDLERVEAETWHRTFDMPTPSAAEMARIEKLVGRWMKASQSTGIELQAVASRPVFPREFNVLIDRFDNKSAALSHVSLELVRDLVAQTPPDGPIVIHCDKHGGRNCYAALVQHFFPDHFVEIACEGRERSIYRFGPPERRVEIRFVAKGDNFLPAALASMACKYLRELSMHAFNRFWQQHVPGLRPTAGYPDDARRFKADIAAAQAKLGISDDELWRKR